MTKACTFVPKPAAKLRETAGTSCATTNWGVRIEALGYHLFRNSVDSFGRRWAYRTFPHASGTVGQFASLAEMAAWVRQVEYVRFLLRTTDE
jgi:hypothetical protein